MNAQHHILNVEVHTSAVAGTVSLQCDIEPVCILPTLQLDTSAIHLIAIARPNQYPAYEISDQHSDRMSLGSKQ